MILVKLPIAYKSNPCERKTPGLQTMHFLIFAIGKPITNHLALINSQLALYLPKLLVQNSQINTQACMYVFPLQQETFF